MLATECKVLSLWNPITLQNNPPPNGWTTPAYDDSLWSSPAIPTPESSAGYEAFARFAATDGSNQDFGRVPLFGADAIWPSSTPLSTSESALIRWRFTLPAELPKHFQRLAWQAQYNLTQLTLNGTYGGSTVTNDDDTMANAFNVGANVIAICVNPLGLPMWLDAAWFAIDLRFTSLSTYVWGTITWPGSSGIDEQSALIVPNPDFESQVQGTQSQPQGSTGGQPVSVYDNITTVLPPGGISNEVSVDISQLVDGYNAAIGAMPPDADLVAFYGDLEITTLIDLGGSFASNGIIEHSGDGGVTWHFFWRINTAQQGFALYEAGPSVPLAPITSFRIRNSLDRSESNAVTETYGGLTLLLMPVPPPTFVYPPNPGYAGIPVPVQLPLWGVTKVCGHGGVQPVGVPGVYAGASMFLTEDGLVYVAAYADNRRDSGDPSAPLVVLYPGRPSSAIDIGMDNDNAWVLDSSGNLWTWGTGNYGQNFPEGVGFPSGVVVSLPYGATQTPFISLSNVKTFGTTYGGCIAVQNDGTVRIGGGFRIAPFGLNFDPPQGSDWGGFSGWGTGTQWRVMPFLDDTAVTAAASYSMYFYVMADGSVRATTSELDYAAAPWQTVVGDDGIIHAVPNDLVYTVSGSSALSGIIAVADNGANIFGATYSVFYLSNDGTLYGLPGDGSLSYTADPFSGLTTVNSPMSVAAIPTGSNSPRNCFAFLGKDGKIYTFGTNAMNLIAGDGSTGRVDPPESRNGLTNVLSVHMSGELFYGVTDIGTFVPAGSGVVPTPAVSLGRSWAQVIG